MALTSPERRVRAAVLMWGLDEPRARQEPTSLSPDEWRRLFEWASAGKILGLLHAAAPDLLVLDDEQQHELRSASVASVATSMMVESSVAPVADALERAGVDWRLLKGAATSHLLYSRPGSRTISDVDLLVRPMDLGLALEALGSVAATGPNVAYGPASATAQKEYLITDTNGVEIDVHHAIQGFLLTSRPPTEAMFAAGQSLTVAGRTVTAPSRPAMFVHAVLHLTSPGVSMSTLPDVARLARLCDPSEPLFDELLATQGPRHLFAWGLDRARTTIALPDAWVDHLERIRPSDAAMRRLDWTHATGLRMHVVNHITGERRVRRLIEKIWPSHDYLHYEGRTHWEHLRYLGGKGVTLRRPRKRLG